MPKGLKETSSLIEIGFQIDESAPNTFTQERIDLQLNPLDNEVFVVYAINLDPFSPDALAAVDTRVVSSLTSTSQTGTVSLNESNCLAASNNVIKMGAGSVEGIPFQTLGNETPPATLEYIGIIATNDFYVQCDSTGNTNAKRVDGKLYGYRAVATADIYAALVQSEVLSA